MNGLLNLDGFRRALAFAGTAAEALVLIDNGLAVLNLDCFARAGVFAGAATNAFFFVNFCCHCGFPFSFRAFAPSFIVSLAVASQTLANNIAIFME